MQGMEQTHVTPIFLMSTKDAEVHLLEAHLRCIFLQQSSSIVFSVFAGGGKSMETLQKGWEEECFQV